jgi:hypothetical protein
MLLPGGCAESRQNLWNSIRTIEVALPSVKNLGRRSHRGTRAGSRAGSEQRQSAGAVGQDFCLPSGTLWVVGVRPIAGNPSDQV